MNENPFRRSSRVLNEKLIYEILSVVEEIPAGCVATYGQIACLIGRERNARLIGNVLNQAENYGNYPCHRVVNREGGLSDAFCPMGKETHRLLLEMDGTPLNPDGTVDMETAFWSGPEA